MTESRRIAPPSPFVRTWVAQLAASGLRGRALDVAAGRGRHSLVLAAAGYSVVAVDIQIERLIEARSAARAAGLRVAPCCADLTRFPLRPSTFALIVCTRYLDRALFPALREALVPGGVLLYETFTDRQLQYGRGPRSPEHLLRLGELRTLVDGLEILFDEEIVEPEAVARVAARRPICESR